MPTSTYHETRFERLRRVEQKSIKSRPSANNQRFIEDDLKGGGCLFEWLAIGCCYVAVFLLVRWLVNFYPPAGYILAAAVLVVLVWLYLRERYYAALDDRRAGLR